MTAAAVDRAFLMRGMDARALNLDQYDPSPRVDSQLERIRALALRLPPGREREALISEAGAAIASNHREGLEELGICGDADQLVTDLRYIERNGRQAISAKAIARHLRGALALIAAPAGTPAAELAAARRQLLETVASIPRLMLLGATVEHELGHEKYEVLRKFAQKNGAGRPGGTADAVEERLGARHGES